MTMQLITSTEAARIAGITPSTFRTLVSKDSTKTPPPDPIVLAGRVAMYERAAVQRWADTRDRKRGRSTPA